MYFITYEYIFSCVFGILLGIHIYKCQIVVMFCEGFGCVLMNSTEERMECKRNVSE